MWRTWTEVGGMANEDLKAYLGWCELDGWFLYNSSQIWG
jgi:hypothetical protein